MKFLQVMSFYRGYQDAFYAARPGLAERPFDEQIAELLKDGFSATHHFAPAMRALGYEPYFVVGDCRRAQEAWARRNGMTEERPSLNDIVIGQINALRPDVLLISDPTALDPRILRRCDWRPQLVAAWRAAPIPDGADWSNVDLFLSSHTGCQAEALRLGARHAEQFRPGFPAWIAEAVIGEEKSIDVLFSGHVGPLHKRRLDCLLALCRAPEAREGRWNIQLLLQGDTASLPAEMTSFVGPGVWGMEMYRATKRSRIVLNVHIDMAGGESQNMRMYETTGVGTFLLTDHGDNVGTMFEPGVELATFGDPEDMVAAIRHFLAAADEREAIARRGQERCLRQHGIAARAADLDQLIRARLDVVRSFSDARWCTHSSGQGKL